MKINTLSLASLAGLLSLTARATAQSFNVDIQDSASTFGIPSNTYGAAASMPGTWNAKSPATTTPTALTDITGTVTTVMIARTAGNAGGFNANDAATSGDDQALLDDIQDLGQLPTTWTITNLAAGTYTLFTYTYGPTFSTEVTSVSVNGGPLQMAGGAPFAGFVQGNTHTVHSNIAIAAGGSITMVLAPVGAFVFGNFGGFQLRKEVPPFVASCFGDGTSTACPCVPGAPGNGCPNNASPLGANLTASGVASIAADTMVLSGSGMPGTSSVLYFQATTDNSPGTVFGDGVRCATGTTVRLGTKANSGGASSYPGGGDPSISVKGGDVAGDVRYYQAYYRDASPAFCTTATFNISNMVSATWAP